MPGDVACFVRLANVAFFDCSVFGGSGGSGLDGSESDGGPGSFALEIEGGSAFFSGGLVRGGFGGEGQCESGGGCGDGGDGAPAISASGAAQLTTTSDMIIGGGGGQGGSCGFCPAAGENGVAAPDLMLTGGSLLTDYGIPSRAMQIDSPIREGGTLSFQFEGEVGDQVFVWASFFSGAPPLPGLHGVFLPGFPLVPASGTFVGALAGSSLDVDFSINNLGPGIEGFTVHFQAVFRESGSTQLELAPMSSVLFLDSAF